MVIDLICAIVAAYGFYLGFTKGIIKTVFALISIFFGIMAAAKFGPTMTDFLQSTFNSYHSMMFLAGMLLTFVLTMMFIRTLARGLETVLQSANINIVNQLAGGFVLSAMLVGLFSILILFADRARLFDAKAQEESLTYDFLVKMPGEMREGTKMLEPVFSEFWTYSVNFMDRLKKMEDGGFETKERDTIFDIDDDADKERQNRR
ncbi:MAG: hypothetical protein DHS20C18_42460 [Saprospiraceae bacterium]|nr:MAG: hypothetical protein DHS20C18_42460 [Saprospiraceae bacterium]